MLLRIFILVLTFCVALLAKNVEFLADSVEKKDNLIIAKSNILAYSDSYLATSNEAIYNQENEILELFGNVSLLRDANESIRANYAKINLNTKNIDLNSSFAFNQHEEIWLESQNACSDETRYYTQNSIASSCNVKDPDWHIEYSEGWINKQSKFMHLLNPKFYANLPFIGDTPIMYLPYFGFPMDKTRRSGLLIPKIGYRKTEGLFFKQPFYIAEYDEWDLEFDPQVRLRRGAGIYNTFRFADSPYSKGIIKQGVFNNKKSYQNKEELKNKKHNGFEVEYERNKLVKYLIDGDFQETLWVDFTYLNDIDYLNLQDMKKEENKDSLVQSKLNYFISTNEHYFGLYGKYYIDTAKIGTKYENDTTLQELPTLHYHSFFDTIFTQNFSYSFDAKYHNYTRDIGVKARQYEIKAPIGFNFTLPNEWANFSITENFYASHVNYSDKIIFDGNYYKNDKYEDLFRFYHEISLSSDLIKNYDDFTHVVNLKLDYIIPSSHKGEISKEILASNYQEIEDNFISDLSDKYTTRNLGLSLTQFLYDTNGNKLIRHSISSGYNYDYDELNDLENKINLYFNNFSFYNKIAYSYLYSDFTKVQSGVSGNFDGFDFALAHNYQKDFKNSKNIFSRSHYIQGLASMKLPKYYSVFGAFEYNQSADYLKMWKAGFRQNKKCWNYGLTYQKDIEPKNTGAGPKSKKTHGIYLSFEFYPFGGVGYDFSIEQENSGN